MVKAPMENQFNSHQSIHSNTNPSYTETAVEPVASLSRTPDHSKTSSNTASNEIMGKCLSVCKERKNPFRRKDESPAVAPSPSPDRNDPPNILTSKSGALANINRTRSAIGGVQSLTDDAKHIGHFGLTFISLSPIDHREKGEAEQSSKQRANHVQEPDCVEAQQPGSALSAVSDSETISCPTQENILDRRQHITDQTPGAAVNNTPYDSHSGEEGILSQNAAHNHCSPNHNLQTTGSQQSQGGYQSSPPAHLQPLNENASEGGLQNEEEDINESEVIALAGGAESQGEYEVSSETSLTHGSIVQRNEGYLNGNLPGSVEESSTVCHGLRRLWELSRPNSHSICAANGISKATEIDALRPGALDDPPMQLTIPSKPQQQERFIDLSPHSVQVLRLPRLQSCKSFDLDNFLCDLSRKSSGLKELAFEDSGQISERTANVLADNECLKKLEIYDPKTPLLRALTIGCSKLEELCLHRLTTEVEMDLSLYIHQKGASLKSLSLNFSLSAKQAEWTAREKQFFKRILTLLDIAVPDGLPELQVLEVSSCPSYEVKHSFDATGAVDTDGTEPLALFRVDAMVRKRQRTLHPQASIIALAKIKLRGHFTAIEESLGVLSWLNQDNMEIEVELPGMSAIYPRGFGLMKPVVLTFLQLDEFISKGSGSPWLELTALRETDLGGIEFLREYNSDSVSIRKETRKLLVTSRESLSRVRTCYKIPTRDICVDMRKMLGQIVPLTPLVSHLDICRDVVLHASVEDYEYMQTLMLLRRWDLKTVQLVCARNYGNVETSNAESECEKHVTEEFLRKLPAFLTILAGACPKLETLLVESEEASSGWKNCDGQTRLLEDAMKAVEVFEKVVPTVNVGTLRGQLQAWEGESSRDD